MDDRNTDKPGWYKSYLSRTARREDYLGEGRREGRECCSLSCLSSALQTPATLKKKSSCAINGERMASMRKTQMRNSDACSMFVFFFFNLFFILLFLVILFVRKSVSSNIKTQATLQFQRQSS